MTLYGSLAATGKGHFTDQAILDVLDKDKTQIIWQKDTVLPFHTNAMKFDALDANRHVADSWTVYSVGGGALREENEPPADEVYNYKTFADIVSWAEGQGRPIWTIVFDNEGEEIRRYLCDVWEQMQQSVRNGLEHEDVLPGGLRLARKAYSFYKKRRLKDPIWRARGCCRRILWRSAKKTPDTELSLRRRRADLAALCRACCIT